MVTNWLDRRSERRAAEKARTARLYREYEESAARLDEDTLGTSRDFYDNDGGPFKLQVLGGLVVAVMFGVVAAVVVVIFVILLIQRLVA